MTLTVIAILLMALVTTVRAAKREKDKRIDAQLNEVYLGQKVADLAIEITTARLKATESNIILKRIENVVCREKTPHTCPCVQDMKTIALEASKNLVEVK